MGTLLVTSSKESAFRKVVQATMAARASGGAQEGQEGGQEEQWLEEHCVRADSPQDGGAQQQGSTLAPQDLKGQFCL